ncbi:hypothetical protein HNQ77_001482 [Silvibacterium bohemicum]|uniref:TonB-dependent receptor-like beta-barrel domain-containing protein n=1 Tax=Silvibacterium bohemicum TaxID=1577686 RepID=A0A841JQA8_9BACT|nr:hypothetical protein [Silvibacterium bohemicum]MBB6143533.1 hypothetical protein [Silvibacterium bohemicum]
MKKASCFFQLSNQRSYSVSAQRFAEGIGVAILLMTGVAATAQNAIVQAPAADTHLTAPDGYTLHESVDLGGHIANVTGSEAMYSTLVNIQSGPRVLGEALELRAIPGTKNSLVDSLSAFSSGFGGDPNNFAKLNFHKGKLYEFSGMFRRHREYFDYDLLANPNLPSGLSIPIGSSIAPTGSLAWPQVEQSPFLFNTVRRMTDTSLTIFPISKVTFRAGYSQNVMEGPSLSPGESVGMYDALLQEYQRNSSDDFVGEIDWKPVRDTWLTFEEEVDHIKIDSSFTLAPGSFLAQEADGTPVALGNWDGFKPYGIGACNTSSMGSGYTNAATYTILSPPQTPGGKPIINPACSVATSYLRSQPTRILYPTEIFRFQSSSIRNVSMNGDVRYTDANMNLPNYYENFQGLDGAIRSTTYTGSASAKRKVTAVDYGIVWDASTKVRFSEQVDYSNVQQPGTANISKGITASTPTTAGNETINYAGALTPGSVSFEGSSNGVPLPDFFGRRDLTNDLTATWDSWSRTTFSLTWRYRLHTIGQGIPHDTPLPVGEDTDGTVTIHENGAVFNVTVRPRTHWDINGSVETLYADNAFTPVSPRETQHYRVHTMYRPKPWVTLSGVFNDLERHNNTNNNQAGVAAGDATYAGPISHVDRSRLVSVGAQLLPNERYGFDLNYGYSDVYASTNICYDAQASSAFPGAASPTGTACPGATVRGTTYYEFGPVKDFMSAPTQYGSVAFNYSPITSIHSSIGYTISAVNGSRFFNDARDVNGSLVSTYQSPEVSLAWTVHKGWIWKAQYRFYGYGEGGSSGAPFCSTSNPTPASPAPVVPCNSPTLAGLQTGLTLSPAGETAPRNFHANNLTLGMHYEF